jgi:hypothetical protein
MEGKIGIDGGGREAVAVVEATQPAAAVSRRGWIGANR